MLQSVPGGVIRPLHLSSRGFGLEVEITALVCKTRALMYDVPISYYGRSYEEGKKIGRRTASWRCGTFSISI